MNEIKEYHTNKKSEENNIIFAIPKRRENVINSYNFANINKILTLDKDEKLSG